MLDKSEKIIIAGKSGSGKNFLFDQLVEKGLKHSIKITTRPIRQNEIEGKDYHFISESKFNSILNDNLFIVNQDFHNDKNDLWKYGVLKEDFKNSQVFIMTPGEIDQIDKESRKGCFIVYLDIDRETREDRLFKRDDVNDSITHRLDSDEKDFQGFSDYDLKITDPLFSVDDIISLMY